MTTTVSDQKVRDWAADWADTFDQNWDEAKLQEWVGKKVHALTPDGEHGFTATIVGYSVITMVVVPEDGAEPEYVRRFGFLTDEGAMVSLFSEMEVSEHKEQE